MDLQAQTFTAGRIEVWFHLLAAALHLAEEMDSLERLGTVAGVMRWAADAARKLLAVPHDPPIVQGGMAIAHDSTWAAGWLSRPSLSSRCCPLR